MTENAVFNEIMSKNARFHKNGINSFLDSDTNLDEILSCRPVLYAVLVDSTFEGSILHIIFHLYFFRISAYSLKILIFRSSPRHVRY